MSRAVIRVGTRKSALALCQTQMVIKALKKKSPETQFEVIELTTTGDFRRDKLNLQVQDKKQWIVELEKAILSEDIDFAVHSGKDVPLNLEEGTSITSVLDRADPRDVLISLSGEQVLNAEVPLNLLKLGAKVGTSSKRRKAQLLMLRPDLDVVQCRGNITTRIDKVLEHNEYDAIVIGQAGVNRLEIKRGFYRSLTIAEMVPAVCQGTLVCQYKSAQVVVHSLLSLIIADPVQKVFEAERTLIGELGADCHSALGVYASINQDKLNIKSRICSVEGKEVIEGNIEGNISDIEILSKALALDLIGKGALGLL